MNELENATHQANNAYRATKGLAPLAYAPDLLKSARKHSQEMADGTMPFGHTGFQWRAEEIQKQVPFSTIAENVAYGQQSAEEVTQGWVNSPGHCKNIEGSFTHTAIGAVPNRSGVVYFTQLFVAKL